MTDRAAADRTVRLRPGVALPDWTIVRTSAPRAALDAAFAAFDMGRKLSQIGRSEDRAWRALLRLYGARGTAPSTELIAAACGLPTDVLLDLLHRLAARDLVVLDATGRLVGAYPFTDRATEHRVRVGSAVAGAMCAIDALGMGAMLGLDSEIRSSCRHCGRRIEMTTRSAGTVLDDISPEHAVVWSGAYHDRCAADSLCTVQAFFCSAQHLDLWRSAARYGADGVRLSPGEALQVGRAVFAPVLKQPSRRRVIRQSLIACPDCGHEALEEMPADACQFFYDCRACGAVLRPKPGDCCVFCSFGSVPCPPMQQSDSCCSSAL